MDYSLESDYLGWTVYVIFNESNPVYARGTRKALREFEYDELEDAFQFIRDILAGEVAVA